MKKLICKILFTALLVVSLAGCGTKNDTGAATETEALEITKLGGTGAQFDAPKKGDTVAEIVVKDFGSIKLKFFQEEAPKAVENFVTHAKKGYYDGLTFHRIINEFMIQGGDPTGNGTGGESIWGEDFEDEFSDNLYPYRGALCMANTGAPVSNSSQFFIVQAHAIGDDILKQMEEQNDITIPKDPVERMKFIYQVDLSEEAAVNFDKLGGTPYLHNKHTVFGQMISGYDILDKIAETEVESAETGVPVNKVVIEKINIYEY